MSTTDDFHDDQPAAPVETSSPTPAAKRSRKISQEDKSALSWLARWIGIPLVLVIAAFYAEPLFRSDRVEHVPQVTYQRVEPYPFPKDGQPGPSLAPPEVERTAPPPPSFAPLPNDLPVTEFTATPIDQPAPTYPRRALESGREGKVRLRVTIGADGNVVSAEVTQAEPKGWFEAAAIEAVKRWRYRPPGRTITTDAEIEFRLR